METTTRSSGPSVPARAATCSRRPSPDGGLIRSGRFTLEAHRCLRRLRAEWRPDGPPSFAAPDRILQLLAEGHSYKSCAQELGLSVDTVRLHVRRIYDRLH